MDEFERRSLYNCRTEFQDSIRIDEDFLDRLQETDSISENQRTDVENQDNQREKTIRLLHHLSSNGEECYQNILQILQTDYPSIASKMEQELLKERTSYSKDINVSLIDTINRHLLPIVYGSPHKSSECISKHESPHASLSKLSDLLRHLQSKCLKILNVPPNKSRDVALPVLISRKIKEQQEIVKQLKSEINDITATPKKNRGLYVKEELSPSEKVCQLRKDLQHQHERVRLLQYSLTTKESHVSQLKKENALIQNQIQDLKRRGTTGKLQVSALFDDVKD